MSTTQGLGNALFTPPLLLSSDGTSGAPGVNANRSSLVEQAVGDQQREVQVVRGERFKGITASEYN